MSDSIDIINAFALLTNFVILPALSYGVGAGSSCERDFSQVTVTSVRPL